MRFLVFCYLLFAIACNNNSQEPYQNNLGIEPALIAQIDTAHYTKIEWKDSIINFGTMKVGDSMHFKFRFKNSGSTPLFIIETRPACGCTITESPKDPIMPGKSSFISATLKSGMHSGEVYKTIAVTTNTKNRSKHTLILHGEILPIKNKKD